MTPATPSDTRALAEEIEHHLATRELVILCGAGISIAAPAGLPAAWPLMERVRRHYTGAYDRHIDTFELRPEVLFQLILRHDPVGLFPLLAHLLGGGAPNAAHALCARALAQGCGVITTNFDTLIEEHGLDELPFRIAAFKAAYMLGRSGEDGDRRRRQLLEEILALPPQQRRPYLPTAVQYATDPESFGALLAALDRALDDGELDAQVAEALVESAYKMALRGMLDRAERYLEQVRAFAEREGEPLLEARARINLCATDYYRHQQTPTAEILQRGIAHAERAIFLLERDIYHDGYFLSQARANQAILLRRQGRPADALALYREVLVYFEPREINLTIHTLYNMSTALLELEEYDTALAQLDRALDLNREHGRRYLLGNLHQLYAEVLEARGESDGDNHLAHLRTAAEAYREAGDDETAEEMEQLAARHPANRKRWKKSLRP
ncbi:SIR2 family protein [Endothiovibrio diazotrophicus]